jgi:hypothetical protein
MSTGSDFWTRRRAKVQHEAEAEARAAADRARAAQEAAQAEKSDAELLDDLDLPDPDTLEAGDDFTAFMARAVPERLRRRALRRLWLTNPALANLDGLLDYGEDFTDAATVIDNLQTAYQVGRGMLRDAAPEDLAPDTPEEAAPPAEVPDPGPAPEAAVAHSDTPAPAPAEGLPQDDAPPETPVPRRRMHFTFDGQETA